VIANRTRERAAALLEHFESRPPLRSAGFDELDSLPPFDVLINATSAGLHGELPPFPSSLVGAESFCYDLVYSVNETPFVTWARRHGAVHAAQGWGMLVEQAAESFFIWRGVRPDTGSIRKQIVL
jgi:shikimate dehydrogenase